MRPRASRTASTMAACLLLTACDALLDPGDPADSYADVTVGAAHTCALRGDGALFCWGDNTWGQLGVEGPGGTEPRRVGGTDDARFIQVDAGHDHTCALRWTQRGGVAWCWGRNSAGQLGDGTAVASDRPVQVLGDAHFSEIRAGGAHTCAVAVDRQLWCWGRNREGQLGNGGFQPAVRPERLAGLAVWDRVDAGAAHTCAVDRHGAAFCWGAHYHPYTLFSDADARVTDPLPLVGSLSWRGIATGYAHTCGVTRSGTGFCVGYNQDGQVGNGDPGAYLARIDTLARVEADDDWVELSAGFNHTCGITRAGSAYCWGDNSVTQLGDGTGVDRPLPQRILPRQRWRVIRAGNTHTCGVTTAGRVICWGAAASGQLGPEAIDGRGLVVPVAARLSDAARHVASGEAQVDEAEEHGSHQQPRHREPRPHVLGHDAMPEKVGREHRAARGQQHEDAGNESHVESLSFHVPIRP